MDGEHRFWAKFQGDELAAHISELFEGYLEELERRGRLQLYRESVRRYYGLSGDGGYGRSSAVTFGGEQGELALVNVNHYRSLIRGIRSLAASSRPAYKATALQDSSEALEQCTIADQLTLYDLDRGLERTLEAVEERMLVFAEGALGCFWDFTTGEIITTEMVEGEDGEPVEQPIYEGGPKWEALSPFDLARPLDHSGPEGLPWMIARRRVSRWDLAARYPKLADDIHASSSPSHDKHRIWTSRDLRHMEHESVYVLECYYARCPALPNGMLARVVGEHLLEPPVPLPYRRIPIKIAQPSAELDEAVGHSDAWDLMGICQLYDAIVSNLATTADVAGIPNFQSGKDDDVKVSDIPGGGRHVKWNRSGGGPPPGWIPPPDLDEGQVKLLQIIGEDMKAISGINSVVRGDPQASLKSGSALAMVSAMAVQYSSALQAAIADLRRDGVTINLENYQSFAQSPRLIEIVGEEHRGSIVEFSQDKLNLVKRIRVELTNPLMRTVAGKKELAEFLADPARWPDQAPMTREQFIAFLESGRYEPLYRGERSSALGIKEETEALTRGEARPVLKSDHHQNHVREHLAALDGRARMKLEDQALKALLDHIDQHVELWKLTTMQDPAYLAITGQGPAPMPAPMGPPGAGGPEGPPGAGSPPGPGGPTPPSGGDGGLMNPEVSVGAMGAELIPGTNPASAGQAPSMPQMPRNEMTGGRASVGGE